MRLATTIRGAVLPLVCGALLSCGSSSTSTPLDGPDADTGTAGPAWLSAARVQVSGHDRTNENCRADICRHNENTDMIRYGGAIYLVHRTAMSQLLGPNSSLHFYKSTDEGKTFTQTGVVLAPTAPLNADDTSTTGRDLRDPHFFIVGDTLFVKAVTRLPKSILDGGSRGIDSSVDMIAVVVTTKDGVTFTPMVPIGPKGEAFWRVKKLGDLYYNASYNDGDTRVTLFSSPDGFTWTKQATILDSAIDTPGETELELLPSGRMLALVRMDGTDDELYGNRGRLRTKSCWADPPFTKWDCPGEITGQRFDGPLSFQWKGRLFVLARRHLQPTNKKRTSLFEVTGDLEKGPLDAKFLGDFPSGGDTAYSGMAMLDDHRFVTSWYSGDVNDDVDWVQGMLGLADIWLAEVDLTKTAP